MSPKEEATAVQLLARWLKLCGLGSETPKEWAAEMDRLEADTRAFIAHEDPNA